MHWLAALEHLRTTRQPGVLVTLIRVRGHAPRDAGAKLVISERDTWGSIGGGNLEATAVERARRMLAEGADVPEQLDLTLNERARTEQAIDEAVKKCAKEHGDSFPLFNTIPERNQNCLHVNLDPAGVARRTS